MSDLIEENVLTEKKEKKYKQINLKENVYAYKNTFSIPFNSLFVALQEL